MKTTAKTVRRLSRNSPQGTSAARAKSAPKGTRQDGHDVVRLLVEHIRKSGLTVGSRLPSIRDLSATLHLGTNVIRDALVQAQTLGIVKIHPRSGAFVQSLNFAPMMTALSDSLAFALGQDDHNLFYIIDARTVIELETVSLAARHRRQEDLLPVLRALEALQLNSPDINANINADICFHIEIARIAGSPVLVIMLRALLDLLRPCFNVNQISADRRLRTERTHREIYRAVLEGNVEAARSAMREHLGLARETLIKEVNALGQPEIYTTEPQELQL